MTRREKRDTLVGVGYLVLVRVAWGWTPGGVGGLVLAAPVAGAGLVACTSVWGWLAWNRLKRS